MMTSKRRDSLSAEETLDLLQQGNQRFIRNDLASKDFPEERRLLASGQFPAAAIVSCIDSRTPSECIFDTGLGDLFHARLAGACANPDLVGSLEFAGVSGIKVLLVMGHTSCGAVTGAIARRAGGPQISENLDGLLERIYPAIDQVKDFEGERSANDPAYVNAVARANVSETLRYIRQTSPFLEDLEKKGLRVEGAMYDITTGKVDFFSPV